ncbi:beta-defensin 135 [Ochotona curzoniae]|uniref:beta-defensin 135 n=1 Tax=Ochotona curzoniae TaxID=130825 RepID=UPI001B34E83B|nr:beta-defensin 135 [Ochotona curzoniae]
MRSSLLILLVLVLLSSVPPVKSGPNAYLKKIFETCWRLKGTCKLACAESEVYHIFCNNYHLCCVSEKDLPILVG